MRSVGASQRCLFALLLFCLAPFIRAETAAARVALVIGNGAYQYAPVLPNPPKDADAIAAALEELGFTVLKRTDLGRGDMERVIREFAKTLQSAEAGLFFYAGHGLQVRGKNYLVPVEARLDDEVDLEFEAIELDSVLRIMERSTKTNLIFLDACRDNPLARNLARSMGTRSVAIGRGLARIETGVGTLIAYSTQPGNVALDGAWENSPFTSSLLKYIRKPGIDVAAMLRRVRQSVITATGGQQVPWSHSSLTGDFYFVIDGDATVTVEVPPVPYRPFDERTMEVAFWDSVKDSEDAAQLEAYLKRYPQGAFAELAQLKLARLKSRVTVEYALTVRTSPEDARVRILNIFPEYQRGMRLKPGRYHIEVTRPGYEKQLVWTEITDADRVLTVSLHPLAASGPSGSVMLKDDYDSPRSQARPLFGVDTMRFEHRAGRGCLTALRPNVVLPAMYPEPLMADFVLEADLYWSAATAASNYGLIFRSDDEAAGLAHYYLLTVAPESHQVKLSVWDGAWVSERSAQLPEGLLSPSAGNRLRVEARSDAFSVYLNERLVAELTDPTLAAPGLFGLSITSGSSPETVCFDNLVVYLMQ